MTLLRTELAEGTVDPVLTGLKLMDRANREPWRDQHVSPGLSPAALSAKYGGDNAYAPRLKQGTFTVPLGVTAEAFRKEQATKVHTWINRMLKMGWEWCSDRKVDVFPGHYPAYEVNETGLPVAILDRREFIARAWFRQSKPVLIRTEIRPDLLLPTYAPGALKHLPPRRTRTEQ